uniref:Leucine rich repeat protein, putative n=1 Tax=Toxoplasma gondii (strain ATCC 50861 / VEG) TaxID=432359 RepID=A0A0F7VFA7_TOXGV|nr:TPA: leucine rich repeat protein, putative [Toxoplasma gondii VEG]
MHEDNLSGEEGLAGPVSSVFSGSRETLCAREHTTTDSDSQATSSNQPFVEMANNSETASGPPAVPAMTRALLRQICKESGQYETPALNDKLYFHFRGFTKIENLDNYTKVRALWLEGNGIRNIEGLDNLKELQCLFLQQNCIREIQNLDSCTKLVTLDLSYNCIRRIQGLSSLPHLNNIKLAYNAFETIDDIRGLAECRALTNLDLSHNYIDLGNSSENSSDLIWPSAHGEANMVESLPEGVPSGSSARAVSLVPGGCDAEAHHVQSDSDWLVNFIELLRQVPGLTCLYFHGNPVIRKLSYYRKRIVAGLPGLRYLDDRPIKPMERQASEAWVNGGKDAETAAIKRFKDAEKMQFTCYLEDFRRMQNKYKENVRRALDRIAREEAQRAQTAASRGERILTTPAEARVWTQEEQKNEIARADAVRRRWLQAADTEQQAIEMPRSETHSSGSRNNDRSSIVAAAAEVRGQLLETTTWRRPPQENTNESLGHSFLGVEHDAPTSVGASTDSHDLATISDDCGRDAAPLAGGIDELPSLESDVPGSPTSENAHFVTQDQQTLAVRDTEVHVEKLHDMSKHNKDSTRTSTADIGVSSRPRRRNPQSPACADAEATVSVLNDDSSLSGSTTVCTGVQVEKHAFRFDRLD